jgi:hypothetical protein
MASSMTPLASWKMFLIFAREGHQALCGSFGFRRKSAWTFGPIRVMGKSVHAALAEQSQSEATIL